MCVTLCEMKYSAIHLSAKRSKWNKNASKIRVSETFSTLDVGPIKQPN